MEELYGKSQTSYNAKKDGAIMASGADWRNPQQTYTNKKDPVNSSIGNSAVNPDIQDIGRKNRKANQLQSNILTHEDDDLRNERKGNFNDNGARLGMGSNASWSAQGGFSKPKNTGSKINTFQYKQN